MPTYEYACEKCGHEFEREQRISDDPIKTCPNCRARKARRLISRTSFVLKGRGWYKDLYASRKPSGTSESQGGAKEPSPGDSKPSSKKGEAPSKSASKPSKKGKSGAKAAA